MLRTWNIKFDIKKVDSKLVRGRAILSLDEINKLKNEGVTQVIDLREKKDFMRFIEKFYCFIHKIKYLNKGFLFSQKCMPDKNFFDEISDLINKNKGKTYMHCSFGLHRTSCGVAMYEKSKNKNENDIIQNFLKYGYYDETNKNFTSVKKYKCKKSILAFIAKFFPEQSEKVKNRLQESV